MTAKRELRGFSLIELLVVVAIIAVLVGLALPALARARQAGRLAVSLSNAKQILIAVESYRFDHADAMPMRASYYSSAITPSSWDTWAFGGKNNHAWWAGYHDGLYDEPAFTRPLNPYLYSSLQIPEPIGYQRDPYIKGVVAPGDRDILEMPVFRSPGDVVSHQRTRYEASTDLSSYEDVGTSYHVNMSWLEELQKNGNLVEAYEAGLKRLRTGASLNPATFVWLEDQFGRLIIESPSGPPGSDDGWRGEFGGSNRSVSAFLDGHSEYVERIPGEAVGPGYALEFTLP